MNRNKWQRVDVPMWALAAKLSEEAAEVGGVLTDAETGDEEELTHGELAHLIEELDHVEFIAGVIRRRAEPLLQHGSSER